MLLSPAVKTSYLSSMAASQTPNAKRQIDIDADHTPQFSGKRARPTISLRKAHTSPLGQPFSMGQQMHRQASFASSSDVTLDDLTHHKVQQRDTYTHSSALERGRAAHEDSACSPHFKAPHWHKVVTSYGYTFVKSSELHLFEGNADVQMIVEASSTDPSPDAPSSPPLQMRYPMSVEFPPTPSPSEDDYVPHGRKYFGQISSSRALWEQVEGDQDKGGASSIDDMTMDEL